MAKELIVNALINILGDYVEGFTKENMKVGILSGKIVLKGLGLNRDGIRQQLNLPIHIVHGHIELLEVYVPWKNLDKEHVQIYVNGVHVLGNPLRAESHSKTDAQQRVYLFRKYRLFQAENSIKVAAQLTNAGDGMKRVSYFQNMIAKVIDNIEFKINNVHIRFEVPTKCISYGISLESFSVVTTNSKWEEAYMVQATINTKSRFKLARLQNLSVYWSSPCRLSSHMGIEEWLSFMKGSLGVDAPVDHILQPPNEVVLKLSHQTPNLSVRVEAFHINLNLDKTQYHQIKETSAAVRNFHTLQRIIQYRPDESPMISPSAWWKYALLLLTENESILKRKLDIAMCCCRNRSRYISLIVKKNLHNPATGKRRSELTVQEELELDEVERLLPMCTLILFRQLGVKEALVQNKQHANQQGMDSEHKKRLRFSVPSLMAIDVKTPVNWLRRMSFGRREGGLKGVDEAGVTESCEVEENVDGLEACTAGDAVVEGESSRGTLSGTSEVVDEFQAVVDRVLELEDNLATFTLEMAVDSSFSLKVTSNRLPVATLRLAVAMECTLRANGYIGHLAVMDFVILDDVTEHPVFSHLVALQRSRKHMTVRSERTLSRELLSTNPSESNESDCPVLINVESKIKKTTVVVVAAPLEICCNPLCIQRILDVVMLPKNQTGKPKIAKKYHDMFAVTDAELSKVESNSLLVDRASMDTEAASAGMDFMLGSVEVRLEVSAPKIIFPEDSSSDVGYLLVDMGHLSVIGTTSFSGMSWSTALTEVRLGMPKTAENMYNYHHTHARLVNPFAVITTIRTQKKACLVVAIDATVDTCISGDIDPSKLARLLRIWDIVSHTFFRMRSLYRLKQMIVQASTSTDVQLIYRSAIDFSLAVVDINIVVEEVQLICHNFESNNSVLVRICQLSSKVFKDLYDMQVDVNLLSMTVEDRSRHPNQRQIVTAPNDGGENFVRLNLVLIRDRKSPRFVECGTVVDVQCGRLIINSDGASLHHFRPYVEVLRGQKLVDYPPLTSSVNVDDFHTSMAAPRFLFTSSATPFMVPAGIQLSIAMRELKVSLLRPHASFVDMIGDEEGLEVVVETDIDSMRCNAKLKGDMDIALGLINLQVRDCRQRSKDNCFKTLLSHSSRRLSEWSHLDGERRYSGSSYTDELEHLTLTYVQQHDSHGSIEKHLDVVVRQVYGYVSLDAAIDISDAVMSHIKNTQALFAPPSDAVLLSAAALAARAVQAEASLHDFLTSLNAKVRVIDPQLVLLEDPSSHTSRAIVCQCVLDVIVRGSLSFEHEMSQITETLRVSAANSQIFVLLNMSDWQPLQILHPMGMHLHITNIAIGGVSTSLVCSVNIEDLVARVTIDDLLLLQSIIVRRSANDYVPPVRVTDDDSEHSFDTSSERTSYSNASYIPVQVTLLKGIFTLGKASVVLINDAKGYSLTMARIGLEQMHFKLDGSSHGLSMGSGSLAIGMDYYNPVVNEWEPFLEAFYPELTLRGDSKSVTLGLSYSNAIQINVSSTLLALVSETMSFLEFASSTEETTERTISSAVVTFCNDLGMPVEIYDSEYPEELLFRIESEQKALIYLVQRSLYDRYRSKNLVNIKSEDGLKLTTSVLPTTVDIQIINTDAINIKFRRLMNLPLTAKTPIFYPLTPLQHVSWHSIVSLDGSRIIRIQSTLEIANDLPFAIEVISNCAVETVGPIAEKHSIVMPLAYADCAGLAFKPSGLPFSWSQNILCVRREFDYSRLYELKCLDDQIESEDAINFRARVSQNGDSIRVKLFPVATITNALPCGVRYRCISRETLNTANGGQDAVEIGALAAGSTATLSRIGEDGKCHLNLFIESLGWSKGKVLRRTERMEPVNIHFYSEDKEVVLILSVAYNNSPLCDTAAITIYSKYLVIDRTSLGVTISTRVEKNDGGVRITRKTYEMDCDDAKLQSPTIDNDPVLIAPVQLLDFTVKSRRRYEVTVGGVGTRVHTDRELRFSYLPAGLRGHSFISTPCDDRSLVMDAGSSLIEFTVDQIAMVFVMFDRRVQKLPRWVSQSAFKRVVEECISRSQDADNDKELFYSVYGKSFDKGSRVRLGYNYSKDARDMFSVSIVPGVKTGANDLLWDQVNFSVSDALLASDISWAKGGNGITLFNCENGRVKLGVNKGRAVLEKSFSIQSLGNKVALEIVDTTTGIGYQIAYKIHRLPALFEQTRVLTIMCRYCLVNCTGEPITVRQTSGGSVARDIVVPAYGSLAWHKGNADGGTHVQIKCQSSEWSIGNIDVNEVGTSEVLLPFLEPGQHIYPTVINVEVKLASPHDNCVVSVIFWRSREGQFSSLSIKNESHYIVTGLQSQLPESIWPMCEIHVPPKVWVPYGWVRPEKRPQVLITLADSMSVSINTCMMDFLDSSSTKQVLDDLVVVSIESQAQGWVILVRDVTAAKEPAKTKRNGNLLLDMFQFGHCKYITISIALTSIAVSLIADRPQRRELFCLFLDDLKVKLMLSKKVFSVDCSIFYVQIDNHSETAIHSVSLWPITDFDKKNQPDAAHVPFFQIAGVREVSASTAVFRYITGRILPFVVEIDSATLELFVIDFLSSLHVVSVDERKARLFPSVWINSYNEALLSPSSFLRLVDIYEAQRFCQQSKASFEHIVFHPIKVYLTFVSLPLPRDRVQDTITSTWLDILTSLATVDLLEVRLKSFIVSNAVESVGTLSRRLQAKVVQDLQSQLAQIAGSLVLGSPAGLLRNIGGGVQDFFYEPALGLVESPVAFLKGIGSGTGSLVSGVVSGTLMSTASIVGGVSNGLSYLSGDPEFVRSRSEQRSRTHAARGGVVAGLKDGGESFLMGIANGITGIFTKPVEEAQRDGALGFVKGLGMGVAGVAVKPVLGITDGISSVAKGVANEIGMKIATVSVKRPRRAFSRSSDDPSVLVLSKFDLVNAKAQKFVVKHARKKNLIDSFICVAQIDESARLIFSELFLYWEKESEIIWYCPWGNIRCALLAQPVVEIVLTNDERVRVVCRGENRCLKLYDSFVQNAHKLSSPADMISINLKV